MTSTTGSGLGFSGITEKTVKALVEQKCEIGIAGIFRQRYGAAEIAEYGADLLIAYHALHPGDGSPGARLA